jgi:hypothetical protein
MKSAMVMVHESLNTGGDFLDMEVTALMHQKPSPINLFLKYPLLCNPLFLFITFAVLVQFVSLFGRASDN